MRHSEPAPISRAGLTSVHTGWAAALRRPARAPVARTSTGRPGKSSAGSRGEVAGEAASAAELDALELTKLVGAEPAARRQIRRAWRVPTPTAELTEPRGGRWKTADSAKGAAPHLSPEPPTGDCHCLPVGSKSLRQWHCRAHWHSWAHRPTQRPQAAHKARATGKGWRAAGQGRVTLRAQARVLSGRPQTAPRDLRIQVNSELTGRVEA